MRITRKQLSLLLTALTVVMATLLSSSQQNTQAVSTDPAPLNRDFNADSGSWHVAKVIDGDTIDAVQAEREIKIRIIGINTPETVDPRRAVQCFGKEASARAHELLDGKKIFLRPDFSQDDVDKYGRSLRFVTLSDGSDYGQMMIGEGYAHEYTYKVPHDSQADYRKAEKEAREAKRGLWAADTCAGDTTKAAS